MGDRKFQTYFFVAVLTASGLLTLAVFRSYLTLLAFGGVFAIVARPLYLRILTWIKSETAAAFLTITVVASVIILPAFFFFAALSAELVQLFANVKGYLDYASLTALLNSRLPAQFHDQVPALMEEGARLIQGIAQVLSNNLLELFSNLFGIVFGILVVLISAYYLLKDGRRVKQELLKLSPLDDGHDEQIFGSIVSAVRAVMVGTLIAGLIKGVSAGIFYWIFGIQAPLFWGTVTGLASFVPIFGSAIVIVPAALYLFAIGNVNSAIALLVLSAALIGVVDNFFQPKFIQSKMKIHPLLVLLSILGGLQYYGFSGFILGPLTLAVTMALLDIYKRDYRKALENVTKT